jgi:tetratricopeptide (TPR) repeat protein
MGREFSVSYTSSDRDFAKWIAAELRALGHVPHVHEWEIDAGGNILQWMEQHHDAADHVLCVVSAEYLKAPYSTLERQAAIWRAARERSDFVLFVVVKPCALPGLIEPFRRCELFGLRKGAASQRFREFMTTRAAPATVPFPDVSVVAHSNISINVPRFFMGRDDSMVEIEATLSSGGGRAAITALRGMRGVGKTVLAAAYAYEHRFDYRATWWIRAETVDTIRADLSALAWRLGWASPDAPQDEVLRTTAERLRAEGEGILLIFDNALDRDSIREFLPRGGAAHVLITSNAHAWKGVAEEVEIRLWPRNVGTDFLIARTGRSDERDAALLLSDALGGLPLAHEIAAAYSEELGLSLAAYRARFDAAPGEVMDNAEFAPADYHDRMTVAKSFSLAIDAAAQRHPAAEPLLVAAALLPPESIPLFVFEEGREKLADGLATLLEGRGLERAVAALRRFGLVDREEIEDERDPAVTTDTIRLHRLIRMVASWRRDEPSSKAILHGLIAALAAVYPDNVYDDPNQWPRARRLDTIALGLLDVADAPESIGLNCAVLCNGIANYRHSTLGDYTTARALFERALAIREKVLGTEHRDTTISMNDLAGLLWAQGDHAAARPLFERALAIREKVGAKHPATATSLNNLAILLRAQGDAAAARPLFERALAIREAVLGAEHPLTAVSLDNLAGLLRAKGELAAARPLFERALAIQEKVLGTEHRDTAISMNNLGACYRPRATSSPRGRCMSALWRSRRRCLALNIRPPRPV